MLTNRYIEALGFAAREHDGQVRKGTTIPYLSHLLAVSSLVMEYGGDEDQAIAGLLHDVIEDVGPHRKAMIADRFGARVLSIVEGCTDHPGEVRPPWRLRKELYIAHLADASDDVVLVSCCDKLHNAGTILADIDRIGIAVFDRFTAGRSGTIWYYAALAKAFARRNARPASQLARIVDGIERRLQSLPE